MSLSISSAFDSGNIRLLSIDKQQIDLEIVRDNQSDFFQWFYFRLSGARGQAVELRIVNAHESAYPMGWTNYRACVSTDREEWVRTETDYKDGILTIRVAPPTDSVWVAYFAPFPMERHHDLIASVAAHPAAECRSLGQTLDGQEIDYIRIGEGRLQAWLYARQHPGETMGEYWMEGALDTLLDDSDPIALRLREKATFHIVPNMNPDGSRRGHLRTNAIGVNLNREWHGPSLERSPEVFHVLEEMTRTGVDFAMDVHGDEAIAANFMAGFEGVPSWKEEQGALYSAFCNALLKLSPDFQTEIGYEIAPPGRANLSMSSAQLAERFGAVSMTLEMPFKDNQARPDPLSGWSPDRSRAMARACLNAWHWIIDDLETYR